MSLNLSDYDKNVRSAIKNFWSARIEAKDKASTLGKEENEGNRKAVTTGKNMSVSCNL